MKLINHNKKNYYDIKGFLIKGTIKTTRKEIRQIFSLLKKEYLEACKTENTYLQDNLFDSTYKLGEKLFCLGTCATRLLVKKYNLVNYKNVNYGIKIK